MILFQFFENSAAPTITIYCELCTSFAGHHSVTSSFHLSVPGEGRVFCSLFRFLCGLLSAYCRIRDAWSLPSVQSLPLGTYQSQKSCCTWRPETLRRCNNTAACMWTVPAVSTLSQMCLYRKAIEMRILISMYIRQQAYLQFIYAHIFLKSSVSMAAYTL